MTKIEHSGGSAFAHNVRDLSRKVQRGEVIRVIHVQTGRHRAWFTRECPGGSEPVPVTTWALGRTPGRIFDDVRSGAVYQVRLDDRPAGYLYWSAPEWLAELEGVPFTYTYKAKSGRVIKRDMPALAVTAGPPARVEVLANA